MIKFNIYNHIHNCQRPSGGSSIFVKSSCPQRNIQLTTELQATAVSVTLDKEITICSIYIPPSFSLKTEHLDSLLKQLPSPYLLLGDFNGHNILWGNKENNSRGELIENFITNNDICLMNDKSNTYMHHPTGSFSSIDLPGTTGDRLYVPSYVAGLFASLVLQTWEVTGWG